jgi:hypothetical protein
LKLGIEEMLGSFLKPEMMFGMLEKMMSPKQRALLMSLPQIAKETYDASKRPAPTIQIVRSALTVAVRYDFQNEDDAIAFLKAESSTLEALQTIMKALEQKRKESEKANES